jgi:HSP20 family protein
MATLVKQSFLPEFDTMERRLRRLFEVGPLAPFVPGMLPAADVYETPTEFVIELEVPGYGKDELNLEVFDHTLQVVGKREEKKDEPEKTYRLQERLERTFARTFVLPTETDGEHVTAEFAKGVLRVHAPKLAETLPHKVAITVP